MEVDTQFHLCWIPGGLSRLQIRSVWVPDLDTCSPTTTSTLKLNFIFTLVTDIVLLSIMLVGLLRLRRHGSGSFALAHILWKQVSSDCFTWV